jgi:hypothetical protein
MTPDPSILVLFYNYKTWRTFLETKVIPKTDSFIEIAHADIEPKFNYVYNLDGELYPRYTMTTAIVSLNRNPFSDYMQTPTGRLKLKNDFQNSHLPNLSQGLKRFYFNKVNFKTEYEEEIPKWSKNKAYYL